MPPSPIYHGDYSNHPNLKPKWRPEGVRSVGSKACYWVVGPGEGIAGKEGIYNSWFVSFSAIVEYRTSVVRIKVSRQSGEQGTTQRQCYGCKILGGGGGSLGESAWPPAGRLSTPIPSYSIPPLPSLSCTWLSSVLPGCRLECSLHAIANEGSPAEGFAIQGLQYVQASHPRPGCRCSQRAAFKPISSRMAPYREHCHHRL